MQSFEEIKNNLNEIYNKYSKLCELLTYEEVLLDKKLFLNFQKQKQILEPIALKYKEYLTLVNEIKILETEIEKLETKEKEIFVLELENSKNKQEKEQKELVSLINKFNAEMQEIIVEIIANKNEESKQILTNLKNGFKEFCNKNNFEINCEENESKVNLQIKGLNVKEIFKSEIGLHKGLAETNGSYCQVFVYDSLKTNFIFNENEITITTCRSSGAGGQHINTTDSSIKVTHNKTGLTAVSQDERSQFQNKQKAIERLKEKLEKYYLDSSQKQIEKQKKEQINLIKNNCIVKTYDFENGKIIKQNKQIILLKNFLQGNEL